MPKSYRREFKIRAVMPLDAVLDRTGLDAGGLRHAIAFDGFPAATEVDGREAWDLDAVSALCRERGVPLPAKHQALLNCLIDGLAGEMVRESLKELMATTRRGRR